MNKETKTQETEAQCAIQNIVGSALHPRKINHGDVWGHGKDWFTFYCPNEDCKRQVSGGTECPHCEQKIVWGNS